VSLEDFPNRFRRDFAHLVGGRLVVALSGGADSMALLHLLGEPSLRLDRIAAHVHHGARGLEADRDADFCRHACARLGVPYRQLAIDAGRGPTDGREAAWRRLRYESLLDLADEVGADAVATAHHRDDVAEGVMLQMLRGTGPRALAGIEAETAQGIIRPLLAWGREDIIRWLGGRDIKWVEDSSNLDLDHLRNRVRHEVLPALRSIEPRIDRHLVHLAGVLARDEAYFAAELHRVAAWIRPWRPDGGVPWAILHELAPPLRSRWLHAQAARCDCGPVTRRQTELFHELVETGSPRAITLAGRWVLRLASQALWLEPPARPRPYELELAPGTVAELPMPGWRIRVLDSDDPPGAASWRGRVASRAALAVRSPRPGDTVTDLGRPAKVTALLARTAPRHLRPGWPVLCENARITWIPGVWQAPCKEGFSVEVEING
jgi:tRNA(Ile)-lysidine synthase